MENTISDVKSYMKPAAVAVLLMSFYCIAVVTINGWVLSGDIEGCRRMTGMILNGLRE